MKCRRAALLGKLWELQGRKKRKNKKNEGERGNVGGFKKKFGREALLLCPDTADEPPSVRFQVLSSEMALKLSIFAVFLYWIQKKMRRSCNTSTLFISYWWFKDTACILDRSEKLMRKKWDSSIVDMSLEAKQNVIMKETGKKNNTNMKVYVFKDVIMQKINSWEEFYDYGKVGLWEKWNLIPCRSKFH